MPAGSLDLFLTRAPRYDSLLDWIAGRLHPLIRHVPGDRFSATPGNLYHFAHTIHLNIEPSTRLIKYTDSNYDSIQVGRRAG